MSADEDISAPAWETAELYTETDVLARTLWGEARGEGREGMRAVGWVARNRAMLARQFIERTGRGHHPLYGDGTYRGACLARMQFSCWNPDDPNLPRLMAVGDSNAAFADALVLAAGVIAGTPGDPTHGATHYFTLARPAWAHTWPPAWAAERTATAIIGGHAFYDLGMSG